MPGTEREVYCFGGFRLSPSQHALYLQKTEIPLGAKSLQVLLYLVQNPGRVVTKEELLKAVWPDSFIEEANLSQHIFRVRKALEAEPGTAKSILTMPGQGYQFTAQVRREIPSQAINRQASVPSSPSQEPWPPQGAIAVERWRERTHIVEEELAQSPKALAAPASSLLRKRSLFIAAVLVCLAVASWAGWRKWGRAPLGAPQQVVLADFTNTTGDATFDRTLRRALEMDLVQSPYMDVLGDRDAADTLLQMGRNSSSPITPAVAAEICVRTNRKAVLEGAISALGTKYLVTLSGSDCNTGHPLAGAKAEANSREGVLEAVDLVAERVRKQLGETAASLGQFQRPIAQATTNSLEALRDYTQAIDAEDRGDSQTAQTLFRRAIELDRNFASAYKDLSIDLHSRGDFVEAASMIQTAWELRATTTERERLSIEVAYNTYGSADYEAAIASMKLYNSVYPNDASNWFALASTYMNLGQNRQAIEAAEFGIRLAPHSGSGAEILAFAYRRANRFSDAKRIAQAAIAQGKDRWALHNILYQIAFLEHDAETMKEEGDWGLTHGQAGLSLTSLGFVAASQGKLREAVSDFHRARAEALHSGDADLADDATMFLAGIQIEYGYPKDAAATLKQMSSDAVDAGTTALFWADLGNPAPAQHQIAKITGSGSKQTLDLYFNLPELRSLLDLKAHRAPQAIEDLEPARKYQMRDIGVPYQRARAETEAGMFDQAAQDYRLIVDNPGTDPIWPETTLAHLRLAHVLALSKNVAAARAEYQTFLNTWRDADPQQPLLLQVKQEYAQLPAQ
jgi:DNA-binding winged helix-turn-helix (wHTH) protein/tetratricopeptide (TPR) repeat protein